MPWNKAGMEQKKIRKAEKMALEKVEEERKSGTIQTDVLGSKIVPKSDVQAKSDAQAFDAEADEYEMCDEDKETEVELDMDNFTMKKV